MIMGRYNGHVANVKRIDTRYYQIGRYWPRENLINEFCGIYYQLLRKKSGSLPSEGACATAKFFEFMTMGFEKKEKGKEVRS